VHQSYDRETFIRLAKLSQEHPDLCEMIPFYDVWDEGEVEDPWFKDFVPGVSRSSFRFEG
jgi:D-amino-acid oxidase